MKPLNPVFPVHLICLLMILFIVSGVTAQKQTTPVKVVVTDMKGKPRSGETIFLTDSVGMKNFSGMSDARGEFIIQLPVGALYHIHIRAIGDDLAYSTLEIPDLKPGEYFDGETVLTIRFEPARHFTLDNVYFDTGKSTLKPSSYPELNELVEYMKLKPSVKIEIAGHTDDVGDDTANMKLSQERANAVKAYLVKKGIASDRVVAKGYGEMQPVAPNDTPEGRQKNRRTVVLILAE